MKKNLKNFTLMEIILAFFILSGTVTFLLVARQESIRQGVENHEKRRSYLQLRSSLDEAELIMAWPDLEFEEEDSVDIEMSELDVEGIAVVRIRATMEMPSGTLLALERWVSP